jgi:hypothetical protein
MFYLYGVQGIGKSEVVKHFLQDLHAKGFIRMHFPDGATFANRHVPGEDRKDLARTMTVILQNLGFYQPPRGDPEVIAADFYKQLYGKSALVAVDNVHGQTEVEWLSSWAVRGLGKVILVGMAGIDARAEWLIHQLGPFNKEEVTEYLNKFYPNVAEKVVMDELFHGNRPK